MRSERPADAVPASIRMRPPRAALIELIRPEARAAGPIDLQAVVQLLDPILNVSACAIHFLVDPTRRSLQIRDHESRIVLRQTPLVAHHLGFDDGATLTLPFSRLVLALCVHVLGLLTRL